MEPSRKNLFLGWRTPAAQSLGVEAFKSSRSIFLVLWQPLAFRGVGGVCWLLTCLAPSRVWGIGVGVRSGLGRSSNLPCLGSLFYPTCVAWLACLEYLAGLYLGILRLPIGPLLGGHCLGSLQVQCEAWDTTGTTYFSFCDFRFSGLSFTQHVGGD